MPQRPYPFDSKVSCIHQKSRLPFWWVHQDSNLGPAGYEPVALTAELWTPDRPF